MFPLIHSLSDIQTCFSSANDDHHNSNNNYLNNSKSSSLMDQFKIEKDGGYVFIKYKHAISMKDTFPDPQSASSPQERLNFQLRRECRGIVFRASDSDDSDDSLVETEAKQEEATTIIKGRIISRKFHKFFNINEREESNVERIDWGRGFIVMEKMDGSLVSPLRIIPDDGNSLESNERKWSFSSMLGFTETGQAVDDFVYEEMEERKRTKLFELCEYCEENEMTPLFEFCSKENKVVIEHQKTSLILLAFRKLQSGAYVNFRETVNTLNKFNNPIPIVKLWKEYPNGLKGIEEANKLLKEIYSQKNIEGYVIRFTNDGDMYKVKTNWYKSLHGLETTGKFIRDRHVIKGILEGNVDDIIGCSFFNGEELKRKALQQFRDEVEKQLVLKIGETVRELREKVIGDEISQDSITGKFYYYLTSEHPISIVNHSSNSNSELISSLFYAFLLETFKLGGREFDKKRRIFYKYLSIDLSVMKPFYFTPDGILSDPATNHSKSAATTTTTGSSTTSIQSSSKVTNNSSKNVKKKNKR